MKTRFLAALAVMLGVLSGLARAEAPTPPTAAQLAPVARLAIQQGGRVKPLDTFARETVREVTGKDRFQGQEPVWVLLRWLADPEQAVKDPLVEVRNLELKRRLELPEDGRWFAYEKLSAAPALQEIQKGLMARQQAGGKLSSQEREEEALLGRLHLLSAVVSGEILTVVPDPKALENPWSSPVMLAPEGYPAGTPEQVRQAFLALLEATRKGDGAAFQKAGEDLHRVLSGLGPYPQTAALEREIHFNRFHPFRQAWILYLLALLLFMGAGLSQGNLLYRLGLVFTLAAFALHGYGFYLRCVISGRAPVTNMYESVIWATFGAVLFALVLEATSKTRSFMIAATGTATVGLVLADNLPAVLDPTIQPLAPVLRNNFWLTVHVLTITLGYAAFLLALGLGHMVLWQYLKDPKAREGHKNLNLALYRTLQIGVLFLAAGTILGGVWANYSWGRFWGWDPKEVWALIALLGYLSLLHGRFAGWLRDFGLAAGSVIAFMGVLMAWYGVNYVLGAGLHSYGFGTGGSTWVMAYVALELLFVGLVAWRTKKAA